MANKSVDSITKPKCFGMSADAIRSNKQIHYVEEIML